MKLDQGAAVTEPVVARLARALRMCGLLGHEAALHDILAASADDFISPTAMFDAAFYRSQLPVALARQVNPLAHYLEVGAQAMLSPHPCFDLEWMEGAEFPARGAVAPLPPIITILEARHAPYATPNVLFEPERYAAGLGAWALGAMPPFEHFLRNWPDNRADFSRYFDVVFYARRNPHLGRARINPLVHYFSQSQDQRQDANPMIQANYYASAYPHVTGDPFLHYVRFGIREGCMPNPYAAAELRLTLNEFSRAAFCRQLETYVRTGV